jgi:type I restriction enzyme, S subunit
MSVGLKPYPVYRDSGSAWLGQIPDHWELRKLRQLLRPVTARNRPDLPLLSVVREKGVILRDVSSRDENRNFIPDDLSNYKIVRSGQFAMNKMKAWQGSYGVSRFEGIVSPAYFVFDLHGVAADYFHDAIRSRAYVPFFTAASDGIRTGQWDLSRNRMREIPFYIPPPVEQKAIARYLDHVGRRVRRFIRDKQKLIKLLEEQQQTTVHRAVTRGLDPSAPLKPSGTPWLRDIPEHWDVVAVRRRWKVVDCKHLTVPFVEDGIPLASVREAQSFELRLDSPNRTTKEEYEQLIQGGRKPQVGDLIYCRNVSVGAAALVTQDEVFAMGQDVCLIRSETEHSRWFNYYLHSEAMSDQLAQILIGSTFNRINVADIKSLLVPLPPRSEQEAIAAYLDEELEGIEATVMSFRRQQALLSEYWMRLVADVVTGQLDVSAAAATLPDDHFGRESVDDEDRFPTGFDADEAARSEADLEEIGV